MKKVILTSLIGLSFGMVGCSGANTAKENVIKKYAKNLFTDIYGVEVNGGRYVDNSLKLTILCESGINNEISMIVPKINVQGKKFQEQLKIAVESLGGSQRDQAIVKEMVIKSTEEELYKDYPEKSKIGYNNTGIISIIDSNKYKISAKVECVGEEEGDVFISIKSDNKITDYVKLSGLEFEDY